MPSFISCTRPKQNFWGNFTCLGKTKDEILFMGKFWLLSWCLEQSSAQNNRHNKYWLVIFMYTNGGNWDTVNQSLWVSDIATLDVSILSPRSSPMAHWEKTLPAMQERQETWIPSLGWEHPFQEEMATHSSILARKLPCSEDPGGLQSKVSQKSWTWLSTYPFSKQLSLAFGEFSMCAKERWPIISICRDRFWLV